MRLSWDWMLYHSAHRQRPARWAQENPTTRPQSSSGVALHAAQAVQAPAVPLTGTMPQQSFPSTRTMVGQQAGTARSPKAALDVLHAAHAAQAPSRPHAATPDNLASSVIHLHSVVMDCKRASKQAPTRPQSGS